MSPTQRTSGVTMLTFPILTKEDFSISNSTKNVFDWIMQALICKTETYWMLKIPAQNQNSEILNRRFETGFRNFANSSRWARWQCLCGIMLIASHFEQLNFFLECISTWGKRKKNQTWQYVDLCTVPSVTLPSSPCIISSSPFTLRIANAQNELIFCLRWAASSPTSRLFSCFVMFRPAIICLLSRFDDLVIWDQNAHPLQALSPFPTLSNSSLSLILFYSHTDCAFVISRLKTQRLKACRTLPTLISSFLSVSGPSQFLLSLTIAIARLHR